MAKMWDSDFGQKHTYFNGFSVVVLPNQGVQQFASIAIDPYHFKELLFFDPFFHFFVRGLFLGLRFWSQIVIF